MNAHGRILFACLAVVGSLAGWWWCTWTNPIYRGITIFGDRLFAVRVVRGLRILDLKSSQDFAFVQRYIGIIQQSAKTGTRAQHCPPLVHLSYLSVSSSDTWTASIIAHEAFHSKQYWDYKEHFGEPVPDHVWMGIEREDECLFYQLQVMERIGAPAKEIEYIRSLDGTYIDLDKDGVFTWKDYDLRNW